MKAGEVVALDDVSYELQGSTAELTVAKSLCSSPRVITPLGADSMRVPVISSLKNSVSFIFGDLNHDSL
jgi:hypothetical protein